MAIEYSSSVNSTVVNFITYYFTSLITSIFHPLCVRIQRCSASPGEGPTAPPCCQLQTTEGLGGKRGADRLERQIPAKLGQHRHPERSGLCSSRQGQEPRWRPGSVPHGLAAAQELGKALLQREQMILSWGWKTLAAGRSSRWSFGCWW